MGVSAASWACPGPAQVDIFGKELLLIPIHLEVHWSLVAVDVARRTITYFDSQRTLNRRCPKVGVAAPKWAWSPRKTGVVTPQNGRGHGV